MQGAFCLLGQFGENLKLVIEYGGASAMGEGRMCDKAYQKGNQKENNMQAVNSKSLAVPGPHIDDETVLRSVERVSACWMEIREALRKQGQLPDTFLAAPRMPSLNESEK